ncbi:MAG: enoyl-CoA hydratase/isomerase family protein, partial [Paracoccus sp. (in: a-proteobacteria)]
ASFTKIGLIPDMGLLATLPARIGPAQARRLMLDNRVIAAPEAQALGIADAVCDPGAALDLASAQVMAQAEGAPLARQLIIDWFARDVAAALDYEQTVQPGLLNSDDAAEGRAAFRDKRPPVFRGA